MVTLMSVCWNKICTLLLNVCLQFCCLDWFLCLVIVILFWWLQDLGIPSLSSAEWWMQQQVHMSFVYVTQAWFWIWCHYIVDLYVWRGQAALAKEDCRTLWNSFIEEIVSSVQKKETYHTCSRGGISPASCGMDMWRNSWKLVFFLHWQPTVLTPKI